MSVAPTVIASAANAGEKLQASELEFPAATTTVMPATVAAPIALVYAGSEPLPPRLMLMIDGFTPLALNQSIAAICQERAPELRSESVMSEKTVASLATPNVVPAAVPAQCVPWP